MCKTLEKADVTKGKTYSWTGSQLGSCRYKPFSFGKTAYFRAGTSSGDDYCPKYLDIKMNNAAYMREVSRSFSDNIPEVVLNKRPFQA